MGVTEPDRAEQRGVEPSVPAIAVVVLVLLAQFLISYSGREPYPSIAMPGFAGINQIDDDPKLIPENYLRIESGTQSELLSAHDLFESAPFNQRLRMVQRFRDMSGADEEWAYLDEVAQNVGLPDRASAAEFVRRDGYGREEVVNRIERSS